MLYHHTQACKQMTLHTLPHILVVHLKRFSFGNMFGKITKSVAFSEVLHVPRHRQSDKSHPHQHQQSRSQQGSEAEYRQNGHGNKAKKLAGGNGKGAEAGISERVKYELYGVIVHHGSSTHSGHYIAYVKAANGSWYEMNDSHVSAVSVQKVLCCQAYILFYSKAKVTAPAPPAPVSTPAITPAAECDGKKVSTERPLAPTPTAAAATAGKPTVEGAVMVPDLTALAAAAVALSADAEAKITSGRDATTSAALDSGGSGSCSGSGSDSGGECSEAMDQDKDEEDSGAVIRSPEKRRNLLFADSALYRAENGLQSHGLSDDEDAGSEAVGALVGRAAAASTEEALSDDSSTEEQKKFCRLKLCRFMFNQKPIRYFALIIPKLSRISIFNPLGGI